MPRPFRPKFLNRLSDFASPPPLSTRRRTPVQSGRIGVDVHLQGIPRVTSGVARLKAGAAGHDDGDLTIVAWMSVFTALRRRSGTCITKRRRRFKNASRAAGGGRPCRPAGSRGAAAPGAVQAALQRKRCYPRRSPPDSPAPPGTLYHNRMVRVIVFSRLLGRKRRAGDGRHRQAALTPPKGAKSDPSGGHGRPSGVVARLS